MPRFHSCNVLDLGAERRFWRFNAASNGQVQLAAQLNGKTEDPLPANLIAKDWNSVFQTKLNIAWLPADQVFLHVVQFPKCGFDEIVKMVEFELEKLSPMPVAQIVWGVELVPSGKRSDEGAQTVVVVIASRSEVEAYLGRLEGKGYLADRLEVPLLNQVLATRVSGDGVWIYPVSSAGQTLCLSAWWVGGVLRHLSMAFLTTPEQWAVELQEELKKVAWAGEVDGWLKGSLPWHLVADPVTAQVWHPLVQQSIDGPVEVVAPLDPQSLAALGAQRLARDEAKANLLPAEYTTRYHQQFIDGLWMGLLMAGFGFYLVVVIAFFGAVQYLQFKKNDVDSQVEALVSQYKEAQKVKEQSGLMQEQVNLRFAGLESLRAVSAELPDSLTMISLSMSGGRTVTISGTGSAEDGPKVTELSFALAKAESNGELLFAKVGVPTIHLDTGAPTIRWTLKAELKRTEKP